MGIIYMFGGSHESDFHNVTRYGSKMCHRSVTGVTGDTTRCGLWHGLPSALKKSFISSSFPHPPQPLSWIHSLTFFSPPGCLSTCFLQSYQLPYCQSTTSYAKLCVPPNISKASLCTPKTVWHHITPCICAPTHATSLFICLFVYPCSPVSCVTCLVCFLSWIASFMWWKRSCLTWV